MSDFTSGADFEPHRATCPSCGGAYLMDAHWKRVCLSCYLKRKSKSAPTSRTLAPATAPIEPDMLRRLVQLCHPDRHGNSESSNTATRFLLQLREAQHG